MQPASLRLWNSSFRSGCPVSSLRDRKPTEERIPQPFSSFIFTAHEYGPLCFCFHHCTRDICSHCGEEVAHSWVYIMVIPRYLPACPLMSTLFRTSVFSPVPAAASCSGGGGPLSPPGCHSASAARTSVPLIHNSHFTINRPPGFYRLTLLVCVVLGLFF